MTSLTRARGYFFENDPSHDHEILVDDAHISCEEEKITFKPILTIWAIIIQTVLIISFEILAFIIPAHYCDECAKSGTSVMSVLIYSHCILWCLSLIICRYLHYQHNKFRRHGYLDFYMQTNFVRQVPVYVLTAGNFILLLVVVLLADYCGGKFPDCPAHFMLQPYHYVEGVASLETAISLPSLVIYLIWTLRFNKKAPAPDIDQGDGILSVLYGQVPATDIGFRDEDRLDDVLEKQADLIRYLKEHNAKLGKKIVDLSNELKTYKLRHTVVLS